VIRADAVPRGGGPGDATIALLQSTRGAGFDPPGGLAIYDTMQSHHGPTVAELLRRAGGFDGGVLLAPAAARERCWPNSRLLIPSAAFRLQAGRVRDHARECCVRERLDELLADHTASRWKITASPSATRFLTATSRDSSIVDQGR
jgi:ATP-dependent protease ClpP protease subunit